MDRQKHGSWWAMVLYIVVLLVVGLIAGAVARFLVPGRDPMGCFGTILLGIVGSFVGGFLASLVFHDTGGASDFHPTGIVGSVIGALIVLGIWHFARQRRLTS